MGSVSSNSPTDVKRSLLFDTYNGYLKTLNKLETIFVAKVANIGTVIVKAESYHNWLGDSATKNLVYVRFTVVPRKARLQTYKIVMRDVDIKRILNVEIYPHMRNEKVIISIYTRLCHYLRLEVTSLFKHLSFPMTLLDKSATYSNIRVCKNVANSTMFEDSDSFIVPVVCCKIIVGKIVTKIDGKFAVVTVTRDSNTNILSLDFYFPQLIRNLKTFLFASTKSTQMRTKFTKNLEKLLQRRLDNLHTSFAGQHHMDVTLTGQQRGISTELLDYQAYIAKIQALLEAENRTHSFSLGNQSEVFNLNNMSLMSSGGNDFSMMEHNDVTVISDTNSERFKTQLYWDVLIKSVTVHRRARNKQILQLGNCRNILKEIVFRKEVMISGQLYYFEVIAEKPKSDYLLKKFKSEMFQNIKGVYYFLKVSNLTSMFEKNSKLTFFKAIELLGMKFEREHLVNIQLIKSIAYLLCKKMYSGIRDTYRRREGRMKSMQPYKNVHLENKNGDEQLPHTKQHTLFQPLTSYIDATKVIDMTLHTRICEAVKVKETDKYELLFKSTLAIKPPLLLEIHLSNDKQEILFLVYNNLKRNYHNVIMNIPDILKVIPFFQEILALGMKHDLGKRLLTTYKNMLIVNYADSSSKFEPQESKAMSPLKDHTILLDFPRLILPMSNNIDPVSLRERHEQYILNRPRKRSNKQKVITISHM